MREFPPGKIIQMTILARDDETSGYGGRRLSPLITIGMDVPNLIGPERDFQFEQAAAQRRQSMAVRTDHP
jgi:hypothetical protein